MSEQEPHYLPQGLARPERVNILERVFQRQGDSDMKSFRRAIIYERLMESGFSIEQAQFLEGLIRTELLQHIAANIGALISQRGQEQI